MYVGRHHCLLRQLQRVTKVKSFTPWYFLLHLFLLIYVTLHHFDFRSQAGWRKNEIAWISFCRVKCVSRSLKKMATISPGYCPVHIPCANPASNNWSRTTDSSVQNVEKCTKQRLAKKVSRRIRIFWSRYEGRKTTRLRTRRSKKKSPVKDVKNMERNWSSTALKIRARYPSVSLVWWITTNMMWKRLKWKKKNFWWRSWIQLSSIWKQERK